MQDSTTNAKVLPLSPSRDVLTAILRNGAQWMLTQAIEAEVADWIERHADQRDEGGRRQVVRNGHLPTRKLMTGLGKWKFGNRECTTGAAGSMRRSFPYDQMSLTL